MTKPWKIGGKRPEFGSLWPSLTAFSRVFYSRILEVTVGLRGYSQILFHPLPKLFQSFPPSSHSPPTVLPLSHQTSTAGYSGCSHCFQCIGVAPYALRAGTVLRPYSGVFTLFTLYTLYIKFSIRKTTLGYSGVFGCIHTYVVYAILYSQ